MGFLSNFRADSLIVKIRTLANPAHPEAHAAVQAKEIDPDDAYGYANDKRVLSRFVTDTGILPKLDLAPNGQVSG